MSAPYWGQLPGPMGDQTRARRLSDGQVPLEDSAEGQSGSHRISVQTTKSDAPTESTLSPFASPTSSSFHAHGLRPRPPSFPYGANQYPPELLENRRRRRSRNEEQDDEDAPIAGPPPPAAPDAPPAPPVSYKYPPARGGLPYPYLGPAAGTGRQGRPMESEEHVKAPALAGGKEGHPVLDRTRDSLDEPAVARPKRSNTDPTLGWNGPLTNGRPRRSSAAEQSLQRSARRTSARHPTDRPRMFADDRSPLQKLELTLDSISKEDKRARAEEAARAACEKAAAAASGSARQGEKSPHRVRFRERWPSVAAGNAPTTPVTPSKLPAQAPVGQKGPLSQNSPDDARRSNTTGGSSPRAAVPGSRIPLPVSQASGIPQRNLSFRERAARSDIKLPSGLEDVDSKDVSPSAPPNNRGALSPSGSNRLNKPPPTESWPRGASELDEMAGRNQRMVSGGPVTPVTPRTDNPSQRTQFEPVVQPGPEPTAAVDDDFGNEFPSYPAPAKLTKTRSQRKADQILGRVPTNTAAVNGARRAALSRNPTFAVAAAGPTTYAAATAGSAPHLRARPDDGDDADASEKVLTYRARDKFEPGQGVLQPTTYLDEWKHATVGALSGALLDLEDVSPPAAEKNTGWREVPQSRRWSSGFSSRPKKAEAFEGEYDETNAPTRFKPPLYLKCGPMLRFCGIRHERARNRSTRNGAAADREVWRGSVMIVTTDADSSYDIAPTLRLFVQPIELLPPPPKMIQCDKPLAPEYVDPIAGHPKPGRKGETLYVRPVDHLDEAKDLSRNETDDGLFEKTRSPPEVPLPEGVVDPPGSFAARRKRAEMDGEKAGKYKDVRGFRLHAERGYTFWRFNIEVELHEKQQRIAYRINRGPSTGFWVPAKGQTMNIMFYSCNGFSMSANPDDFSGPDPLWRDVLNTHQSQPFHVMIGGGDQIYNDRCMQETKLFRDWLMLKNPLHKRNAPFTPELQDELETYYLERYAMWFSQGLFGMANSQIPMVNMFDGHDIIDGYGSYPHHYMSSPVFSGLGNVAFKYYMLFQHQSVVGETEKTEPSWTLGVRPGPYIHELSRSLFMFLGARIALLGVDTRTERTLEEVVREDTWKKIMDRCYAEIDKGNVEHLLVVLGLPIAYPRLVWLEKNILTSRVMNPVKALAKVGLFGGLLNHYDGGVEVLDDLDDHWTARNHKQERSIVIEDLQDLAADKSIRVTILSGDVRLAAVGQFYSNPKLGLAKHKDFRYIPNVISSAIANAPPPDLLADVLNKRNKLHHFDKETDEDMIPVFGHGVDGRPRNNKHLLPHRNWCAIRPYVPGQTPLPTPDHSAYDLTPLGLPPRPATHGGEVGTWRRPSGIFRWLSMRSRGQGGLDGAGATDRSRPPLSGGRGLLRALSRRRAVASAHEVGRPQSQQQQGTKPSLLTRTLSSSSVSGRLGGLFRRRGSTDRKHDGGIDGVWGPDTDEDERHVDGGAHRAGAGTGAGVCLRGGLSGEYDHGHNNEFHTGDESYFSVKPHQSRAKLDMVHHHLMSGGAATTTTTTTATTTTITAATEQQQQQDVNKPPKPFHFLPTALSARQRKRATDYAVDLRGALEVTLNVEISARDPGGSTVPYRLVVPRLWYEYEVEEDDGEGAAPLPHPSPRQVDVDGQGEGEGEGEGEEEGDWSSEGMKGRGIGRIKRLISRRRQGT